MSINLPAASDALFAAGASAFLLAPFVPAWREWFKPTDDVALEIPDGGAQEPLYMAQRMRDHVGAGDALPAPIVVTRGLRTSGDLSTLRPVYGQGDLELKGTVMLDDVMSEGKLQLGPDSEIVGWAHAEGELRCGPGSVLIRRGSSATSMTLAVGCCFENLHAPVIRFGDDAAPAAPRPAHELLPAGFKGLPRAALRTPGVWRIDGDCELPGGRMYEGSLIVTGVLRVGERTCIHGSVKAYGGVLLGEDACVTGAVVCQDGVHLMPHAEVGGPLVSETHLLLSVGAKLGRPQAPTTVNADAILAQEGVVAYGSVWARQAGVVVEAT